MSITLRVENLDGVPDEVAHDFVEMVTMFERCLNLMLEKDAAYGGAWKRQGWMGNLARVMSKVARLRSMLWNSAPWTNTLERYEGVEDTLDDLINLAAFMRINWNRKNRWGAP